MSGEFGIDRVLKRKTRLAGRIGSLFWRLTRPLLTLRQHARCLGPALFCPVYHIVRESQPAWWGGRYRIKSPREFERDLDLLLSLGGPVDLGQLLAWRRGHSEKPVGWFLSFDDGYRELHDVIAPILLKKGIPATFFICSSFIDNQRPFFEDVAGLIACRLRDGGQQVHADVKRALAEQGSSLTGLLQSRVPRFDLLSIVTQSLGIDIDDWLAREQPYLTSGQLRSLLKQGFTLGAHSIDHPLFSGIPEEQQLTQLQKSLAQISNQFNLDYKVFAFPYGEFGLSIEALTVLLREQFVDLCFGTRGIVVDELEPRLVQRMLSEEHRGALASCLKDEMNLQLRRWHQGRWIVRRIQV